MAYEDLTPQERQILQQSLLAPPPATFAAPGQIDPDLRLQAQMGLLGSEGRFIEQMARQQEEAAIRSREDAIAKDLASAWGQPDFLQRAQTYAQRDPAAFNSGTVQQVIQSGRLAEQEQKQAQQAAVEQRGAGLAQAILESKPNQFSRFLTEAAKTDLEAFSTPLVQEAIQTKRMEVGEKREIRAARREVKQERAKAEVRSAIANASPEQLDQFAAQYPEFLPDIEKRSSDLSTIEEAAAQLPPSLRTPENLSKGHKAKAALTKFNRSLPPQLQKLTSYEQRKSAVDAADAYIRARDAAVKAAEREGAAFEESTDLANLRDLATVELGLDPTDVTLPDPVLAKLAKSRSMFEEVTVDSFDPRTSNNPLGVPIE